MNTDSLQLVGEGRTAEIYAWGDGQVLKLYRAGMPGESADYEAFVGRLAHEAGLAAPAVAGLVDVDGRRGILYERIDGPSMLDVIGQQPASVAQLARQFAELQVAMHNTDRPELPSQRESLARSIQNAPLLPAGLRERVLQRLDQLPDGESVCHGDYHPGNVVMSQCGPVVIDWMTATRGNPLADVARTTLMFRLAQVPPYYDEPTRRAVDQLRHQFFTAYLAAYRQSRPAPDELIEVWFPIIAAARLEERIEDEQALLLELAQAVEAGTG